MAKPTPRAVIERIREILWWDSDQEAWDFDKEWDVGFLDMISEQLHEGGFGPPEK